jgi:hypothetical protein
MISAPFSSHHVDDPPEFEKPSASHQVVPQPQSKDVFSATAQELKWPVTRENLIERLQLPTWMLNNTSSSSSPTG